MHPRDHSPRHRTAPTRQAPRRRPAPPGKTRRGTDLRHRARLAAAPTCATGTTRRGNARGAATRPPRPRIPHSDSSTGSGRIERLFRVTCRHNPAAATRGPFAGATTPGEERRKAASTVHQQGIRSESTGEREISTSSGPKMGPDLDVVVATRRIPQDIVVGTLDFATIGSVDSARSPGAGEAPAIEERQQNGGPDTAARSVKRRSSPDRSQLSPTRVRGVDRQTSGHGFLLRRPRKPAEIGLGVPGAR